MDPYGRYVPPHVAAVPPAGPNAPIAPDRVDPRAAHASYVPTDGLSMPSHTMWVPPELRGTSDILQNDGLVPRPASYALDNLAGIGRLSNPGLGGAGVPGYSPLKDVPVRRDASLGLDPVITEIERANSVQRPKALPIEDSNILFVDGLPTDCTRREVGHLFRPFVGFKEIRVIHKEPRHTGDKARVLCFVEFTDPKCALTALDALQGYKFDDKKPDAPVLRIQFATFPFRPALVSDDARKHGAGS